MQHYEFLVDYYNLQMQVMFAELLEKPYGLIGYSHDSESYFWNNLLLRRAITVEELTEVEEVLGKQNRKPAIYFERTEEEQSIINFVTPYGYKFLSEDCWMSYRGETLSKSIFRSARIVKSEAELEVFLEVFNKCYRNDDPQNPYGELGDYLETARKRWISTRGQKDMEYVLVYDFDNPVAVAALTSHGGIGYISNVGSLPKVRGLGYGKIASLFCVALSQEKQNTIHCLATENGTYPYEFYKRLGFEKEFSCLYYGKG